MKEETPLFRKGRGQEVLNEPNTPSNSEEVHNDGMKPAEKVFNVLQVYKNPLHFCIYYRNIKKFQALNS